ncbi:hypothetical protein NP493_108g00046 [Ridgeia piscesae]|uniref:Uncharacterized protein n=1 Tax=Ridgeia piscesae TaxID=27915 RepID=A0AAD9P733_RIDPI|nr:hypothetical protein NP493_108g00046 [Ridgeia piscesae]
MVTGRLRGSQSSSIRQIGSSASGYLALCKKSDTKRRIRSPFSFSCFFIRVRSRGAGSLLRRRTLSAFSVAKISLSCSADELKSSRTLARVSESMSSMSMMLKGGLKSTLMTRLL